MRTLSLLTVAAVAALILGSCGEDLPAVAPDPPDLLGTVIDVDSPEIVAEGRTAGALKLTLADGSVLEVPRGVAYDGPKCIFVGPSQDFGGDGREPSDCVIHVGMKDGDVQWIQGFRIEPDGKVTVYSPGDLVEVNMSERFVVTRWGGTLPWRGDPPVVDCALSGDMEIDGQEMLDHAAFNYYLDTDGYLVSLVCGYEE